MDGDEDDGEGDEVDGGVEEGDGCDDGDPCEVAHVFCDALVRVVDFLARLEYVVAGASMPSRRAGKATGVGNPRERRSEGSNVGAADKYLLSD